MNTNLIQVQERLLDVYAEDLFDGQELSEVINKLTKILNNAKQTLAKFGYEIKKK